MLDLIAQHREVLVGNMRFSDILMPNGETLANCSEDYVWQVGRAMSEYACDDLAQSQMPEVRANEITKEVDNMLFGTN